MQRRSFLKWTLGAAASLFGLGKAAAEREAAETVLILKCDVVNSNGRLYPREVVAAAVGKGATVPLRRDEHVIGSCHVWLEGDYLIGIPEPHEPGTEYRTDGTGWVTVSENETSVDRLVLKNIIALRPEDAADLERGPAPATGDLWESCSPIGPPEYMTGVRLGTHYPLFRTEEELAQLRQAQEG